ncbi:hypothetical protein PIB30_096365 [Stylosanthes scabra]|uniref:Uncharacterized protein n=1 Tax=Stylosanthes scabra TaxID=79078 RepID=A0ABU6UUT8_9FABA|nr:hypothetical protein [Stylosanthes scabra]
MSKAESGRLGVQHWALGTESGCLGPGYLALACLGVILGTWALILGAWRPVLLLQLSQACSRLKPIVNHRYLYTKSKPRTCEGGLGAQALKTGAWALGLKSVVHYRLLYTDAKPQMLAFKCNLKNIIWSFVAQVIPLLVQRGHAGKLTKTHGHLGIKVERLGAHFFASRAQNQRLGIQGWCLGIGVGGEMMGERLGASMDA